MPSLPVPLVQLVPHRGPMLLLEELEQYSHDMGEATGTVAENHLFRRADGSLFPVVLVEVLAQAAAAHEGYRRLQEGAVVGGGFLAGVRDFSLHRAPRRGDELRAVAVRDLVLGAMQTITGHVERAGELLAEGSLVFYLSDDAAPEAVLGAAAEGFERGPASAYDERCLGEALVDSRRGIDRDTGVCRFSFEPSFPAFNGHFPELPILPAVVSVVCAEAAIAALVDAPVELERIKSGKFIRPILPGSVVELSCSPLERGEAERWKVHIACEGETVAKLDLFLTRS